MKYFIILLICISFLSCKRDKNTGYHHINWKIAVKYENKDKDTIDYSGVYFINEYQIKLKSNSSLVIHDKIYNINDDNIIANGVRSFTILEENIGREQE